MSCDEITVDACGLVCPEPVMMLHTAVRDADSGALIKMLSTDPSSERDVEKFCRFLNHELLEFTRDGETLSFLIRKG